MKLFSVLCKQAILCNKGVFFSPLFSCNFDDQYWAQTFTGLLFYACWDTLLWQLSKVYPAVRRVYFLNSIHFPSQMISFFSFRIISQYNYISFYRHSRLSHHSSVEFRIPNYNWWNSIVGYSLAVGFCKCEWSLRPIGFEWSCLTRDC